MQVMVYKKLHPLVEISTEKENKTNGSANITQTSKNKIQLTVFSTLKGHNSCFILFEKQVQVFFH